MSEIRTTINEVVAEREGTFGDLVKNLTTGRVFMAEIETISDIELQTRLGADPREAIKLHVRDQIAANEIASQTRIEALELGAVFIVLGRSDNPNSVQVEFRCRKKTSKDQ